MFSVPTPATLVSTSAFDSQHSIANRRNQMSTSQNKNTVRRFYHEVITSQDGQAVREVIAPDITVHDPIMGELHGIDDFHQLIGVFQLGFPQQSATVEALVAEDDLV